MAPPSPVDKISPTDPRVTHEYASLGGHRYHYLLAVPPSGTFTATTVLVHGWPDLSLGWRYQIPALLSLSHRVVVPDMLGYGRTDSPAVPPAPLSAYSVKSAADAVAELAEQLGARRICVGGHDWGGVVAWRVALWHPGLVERVFVVCTPYTPPAAGGFVPLAERVERRLPNFRYQLQLGSSAGEVEREVRAPEQIRQLLRGAYGGRGEHGEQIFSVERGVHFENLGKITRPGRLLTREEEDYYVREYARSGLAGPLNWYRTTKVDFDEEREGLEGRAEIGCPALFVSATRDEALPEWMSRGMEAYIPNLVRRKVEAGHWALWQSPAEVNGFIEEFLTKGEGKSRL